MYGINSTKSMERVAINCTNEMSLKINAPIYSAMPNAHDLI